MTPIESLDTRGKAKKPKVSKLPAADADVLSETKDAIATARLWLAEGLLKNGLSVAAVADRCGFPSADTFARSWKRAYGSPPSKDRK